MKKLILLTMCVLVAAPALAGAKPIDESLPASPDADVSIELIAGKITIVGWDRNEVHVTGTINDRWEEFEMKGDKNDISIEISPVEGEHRDVKLEADLQISVPRGAELSVESVSAPLDVQGLAGSLSVESVSGSIGIGGGLRELEIEAISGEVEIETTADLRAVSVEIVTGSVVMSGDLHSSGDYSFESVSGKITLEVPAGFAADYEIETFSGKIENDFGPRPEKADLLPAENLSFTVGSGGADVSVETLSGVIRLKER